LFSTYDTLLDLDLDENAFDKNFDEYVQTINEALSKANLDQLTQKASKLGIKLVEELSYSRYNGRLSLNQVIIDNYRIFKDKKNFNLFVEKEEQLFKDKFNKYYKESDDYEGGMFTLPAETNMTTVMTVLGLKNEDFGVKTKPSETRLQQLEIDGKLNPLIRKFI